MLYEFSWAISKDEFGAPACNNMKSKHFLIAGSVPLLALGGLLFYTRRNYHRDALPPAGYPQIKGWSGGHDQEWDRLPFKSSSSRDVPAARTPDGSPLTFAMVAGRYGGQPDLSGSGVDLDSQGNCTSYWFSCLDSGSAKGIARIVDGRVEIEGLSTWGKPTGERCYCVPAWWRGRVYLLGPSDWLSGGVLEFCNAINWGEVPENSERRGTEEYLLRRDEPTPVLERRTAIPEGFDRCIMREPLEGELVAASSGGVRVSLGSRSGVFVGQRLRAQPESGYGSWLRVLSVEEDTCTVGPYREWRDEPLPPIGTRVHCEAKGAGILEEK
ncbi:MAG: hypothetical protein FD180_2411 [Planctomycetota bacterium]|nr:MAG: hypothetical protein FD180_2411 [Planctomycetota bacterium]